jgi:hypothetical protein
MRGSPTASRQIMIEGLAKAAAGGFAYLTHALRPRYQSLGGNQDLSRFEPGSSVNAAVTGLQPLLGYAGDRRS